MKKTATDITELIGHTPILQLNRYSAIMGLATPIKVKVEYFNPGGSVKDRLALAMIEDAESKGLLRPGSTIIEPTSGNTGIGLAMVAAVKGYRLILTMPETMSAERKALVRAYGAKVVLTKGVEGMKGAIAEAERLRDSIPGAVIPQQFENPVGPEVHYRTTGPEIWQQTDGDIDIFVAGVGTGGTISGTGRYLKEMKPEVEIVGVEPKSSAVLSGGRAGAHMIQGIGAGFVPKIYDGQTVDRIIAVANDDAIRTSRLLAGKEGLLTGFSAGAAVYAATQLALQKENSEKTIVALLPDNGERYLSTVLFDEEKYPL